jgi:para-aminobenzoate synthetase / 4-amino-4-deoxychorismate lyase
MPAPSAIIYDANLSKWCVFSQQLEIISTHNPHQLESCLLKVQDKVEQHGLYAAGFVSYEAATALDSAFATHTSSAIPLLYFALYSDIQLIDNLSDLNMQLDTYNLGSFTHQISQAQYLTNIAKIKQHLAAGDTYQVNYTWQSQARFSGDIFALWCELYTRQPTTYAAFIDTAHHSIASTSPELFFSLDGNKIVTKPMKGTIERGLSYKDDLAQAAQLTSCSKNRAENLMIVDMLRNDLSHIAVPGSIEVTDMFATQPYPSLWQMTSKVKARTNASLTEIFTALFPCASITGAPKVAAMEIIKQLEVSARGIYTGAIGFYLPNRRAQFNVGIRTLSLDKTTQSVSYGTGSGVVMDSQAQQEYAECVLKTQVLSTPQQQFALLETILWQANQQEYFLLDLHLQRLTQSSSYFDFLLDQPALRHTLTQLTAQFARDTDYKVRLLLAKNGTVTCEHTKLAPTDDIEHDKLPISMQVAIASDAISRNNKVSSDNKFLYHKTTLRDIYKHALAAYPDADDVLLLNERQQITEACNANVVIEYQDKLITPPISCGLLCGTFRQDLLERGIISEQVITRDMLAQASAKYLINSVRKWCKFELRSS